MLPSVHAGAVHERRPCTASHTLLFWDTATVAPAIALIDGTEYNLTPRPPHSPNPLALGYYCDAIYDAACGLVGAFEREWRETTVQDCKAAMESLLDARTPAGGGEYDLPPELALEIVGLLARFYVLCDARAQEAALQAILAERDAAAPTGETGEACAEDRIPQRSEPGTVPTLRAAQGEWRRARRALTQARRRLTVATRAVQEQTAAFERAEAALGLLARRRAVLANGEGRP